MNIVFFSDWLAKKSIRDFTLSEKMLKSFERYLTYMSESDPNKISLTIEQAIMTCLMIEQIKSTCLPLLSQEDQNELAQITLMITQSTKELQKKYPEAFEIIASDLADDLEKQLALAKLLEI